MTVLLVRHAKAGDRDKWEAPDDLRPLTTKGEVQAQALVDLLAGYDIDRVLSSPYLRCTQTVAPLAAARGLAVEPCDDLAEGEGRAGTGLARSLLSEPACTVLCSHGDVVEEVLDALSVAREQFTRKGATWVLDEAGAHPLDPPG
ncbi:MAG TPA: phosphoglycerate mutase family protein [Acidimicrobiales bacterium]|nr:phosphoglycerate mutase family protein [Acidimicrobiales bacterium]